VAGTDFLPIEVGGKKDGFRITGTPHASLRIEAWGYWPSNVASAFAREAQAAVQKLATTAVFTLDVVNLKPQGAEGQDALRALLRALSPLAFAKGVVIASNILTGMQIARLLRECKLEDRVVIE
jgi:hypothetical protein